VKPRKRINIFLIVLIIFKNCDSGRLK